MALVNCVECGYAVSTDAHACPGCGSVKFAPWSAPDGRAQTKSHALLITAGAGIVVVTVMTLALSSRGDSAETKAKVAAAVEASKTPQQRAQDSAERAIKAGREADFQFAVRAAKGVKLGMKNPASFELVSATLIHTGALCMNFRGTNSFNAVVTQSAVVRRDFAMGDWSADCTGKAGQDMMLIRHAL